MKTIIILIFITILFVGVCAANSPNKEIPTYYALIEPDLEGHAYFQINVQNFDYNQSRIFGISVFKPYVENYKSEGANESYEINIQSPDASIDIFYNNGKIETIDNFSGEFEFLGDSYFNLPVPSQIYYVNTTDEMKNNNISNFNIKYYDSNFNSKKHYDKYPFDYYNFTYDIAFLNESFVMLTISPINPNNFYDIDVLLNHVYKNKNGQSFEEKIDSVYDGVYKINFETKNNESLDEIKITYTRKMGLSQVSFFVLAFLIILILISIFAIKIPQELNAIVFGTFLTIYTFSASIGYAYKPSWLNGLSWFDGIFIVSTFLIIIYFILLVRKWKER
ncbi:hypothetical protein FTO70_03835 [Methanosarcina sp. KYL-1]|uniref:hypothetical protein n=1 Tax=Methanosarcina sp. KYL-1 TaxID=2602068 RepID=UPI0021011C58|nr:hypothetical protein [Methanosarcina sp. KYL-1]MCQ1534834.1 hypothetical protein [Methanosarcina sp. KYL-1]